MALQMTWHPRCRRAGPPLGLKNLGNSCYLNSVLQCLTYTPPLAQFCLSSQHSSLCKSLFANREKECPFCILERQITRSLSLDGPLDAPSKIQRCLTLFAEHFRWGRQEDAHEFLRYVIDACHNACLKLFKSTGFSSNGGSSCKAINGVVKIGEEGSGKTEPSTVMKEIFGGALLSQVKCLSCKAESNKTDEIMDICLDLFQSNSLKEALSRFFQPEMLDGNNKYNCGNCKKLSVARKQMFLLRAPNVLVIQLKRFEGIHGGKINKNIEFDEVLALSKFMYKMSQDLEPEYSLFGSIVHSGFSPESGHYYAYIKDASGRWYCCNDAHVSLSSTREVLSEKVYILFYLRSNQSPQPNKTCSPCDILKLPGTNGNDSSNRKPPEVSKPTTIKQNGFPCKSNVSIVLKNGKISSALQSKQTNLKSFDTRRVESNGNGSLGGNIKIHIGKNDNGCSTLAEANNGCKVEKSSTPKINAADVKVCSGTAEQKTEQSSSLLNGNGSVNPLEMKRHVEYFTLNVEPVERDFDNHHSPKNATKEYQTCTSTCKEESCKPNLPENSPLCNTGSGKLLDEYGSGKIERGCVKRSSHELEKFKEMLAREASSELQSCGWVDKVQDFMRARKRLCMQARGTCSDNSLVRQQLIVEAKKTFISQVPESLKEHLVQKLVSYNQGNSLLDA